MIRNNGTDEVLVAMVLGMLWAWTIMAIWKMWGA